MRHLPDPPAIGADLPLVQICHWCRFAIGALVLIGLFVFISLLSPSSAFAACYCQSPGAAPCRCTATPPSSATYTATVNGVAVSCDTQAEAQSVFATKAPICGSTPEIVPYCAYKVDHTLPDGVDHSEVTCYGTGFFTGTTNIPKSTNGLQTWNKPVDFNGFSDANVGKLLTCESIAFCCARSDIQCSNEGVPQTPSSCTPQNPSVSPPAAVCGAIPPPGGGTPPPSTGPAPDYPPSGTLCAQYQYLNEPHPLRPAPALVCEDKVPTPFNLSCANDVLPTFTVQRPRSTGEPGDSIDSHTSCSSGSSCRLNCHRDETLTEGIIGPITVTIDLTPLELPIAGVASRDCESGQCYVDILGPTGTPLLSDGLKMRNYTSWFLQGAIEQAEQEPLNYEDTGPTQKRVLQYAGPLKKLIPKDVLDGKRLELIQEAIAGRTYDQIVGYVEGDLVISRRAARARGLTTPAHEVRLTAMNDHVAPAWDPHSPDGNKWYYLWQQVPFTGKEDQTRIPHFSGHIDTAGEVFPTACIRSNGDPRRCQSDPTVLDAVITSIPSGLDSFRTYFPHSVEDDTLLMSLLQNALISSAVPDTNGREGFPLLTEANLQQAIRDPSWTVNNTYRNADGCKIENALYNPGDSLEAKRNKKAGIINATVTFKKEVHYDYEVSLPCDLSPIGGDVPVSVAAPVPVHIRYSHMDEIADRAVIGKGSIFKAFFPDIANTIGDIVQKPAESALRYLCGTSKWGACTANSTSTKGSPRAFFANWGTTLELFHRKIQCMLDPLKRPCNDQPPGIIPPGGIQPPGGPPPGGTGTLACTIPLQNGALCKSINWNSPFIQAYIAAYNQDNNSSWTLVGEPWAQQMIGNNGGMCPSFVLTLWLEESGGSAVGSYDLGCIYPLGGGGQQVRQNRHPTSDADVRALPSSDRCLGGVCANTLQEYRQSILSEELSCLSTYTSAIGDFQTFMCQYSGEDDIDPTTPYRQCTEFTNNPNFPVNVCRIWDSL